MVEGVEGELPALQKSYMQKKLIKSTRKTKTAIEYPHALTVLATVQPSE